MPKNDFQCHTTSHQHLESPHTLTSHGAEAEASLCVVVCCSAAPLHAVSTAVSGAVGVVPAVVEVGELAQSTIRISASCCYNYC